MLFLDQIFGSDFWGGVVTREFVVSGDSHVVEPVDLYKTRLPKGMRDDALWEEDTILAEPLVPGGHTEFRTVHTVGYNNWTVSRYRQFPGPTPDGHASSVLRDMDRDGVDATLLYPNLSFFALYTDWHERSIAHARVYNDWLVEEYGRNFDRIRPCAAIPTTDPGDAVREIERAVSLGLSALILPEYPQPWPYWAPEYEPIWDAAEANGVPVFFHVASGGVRSKADTSETVSSVKSIMTAVMMGQGELDRATLAARTGGGGNITAASPMRIIADLVSAGVCERHPDLMFNMIEFNAGWLAYYMGQMDRVWRVGVGQDPDWWLGFWEDEGELKEQKLIGRLFEINTKWPWPLKPSEYVKRNIRVQFADDRIAVLSRHITGTDTIYWGNDYPHAEGTWLGSQRVIEAQFEGVGQEDRAKMLGSNLAAIVGFDTTRKFAPVDPAATPATV
jgi:predicted TIM-barrel fold metal-dependent hydrolase